MISQLWPTQSEAINTTEPLRTAKNRTRMSVLQYEATSSTMIRIGAVNYLNSKPLVEDVTQLVPDADFRLDYPSRLADELAAGRLDVALIPSIECMRAPNYEIVSDACVATRGAVLSVKLYSRCPLGQIRTLALDAGSRTSAALTKIMLHERFGVRPSTMPLPLGSSIEDTPADAILLIGDRAMLPPRESFAAVWDLGEEWLNWTGLPFVFAMWVARSDESAHIANSSEMDRVATMLSEARNRGVARIPQIAQREATKLGISTDLAENYLKHNLHFCLGSAEQNGLRLFQELATQLGLAPEGVDLVFRDHTHSR
jgi:chorismate dehydratase